MNEKEKEASEMLNVICFADLPYEDRIEMADAVVRAFTMDDGEAVNEQEMLHSGQLLALLTQY